MLKAIAKTSTTAMCRAFEVSELNQIHHAHYDRAVRYLMKCVGFRAIEQDEQSK